MLPLTLPVLPALISPVVLIDPMFATPCNIICVPDVLAKPPCVTTPLVLLLYVTCVVFELATVTVPLNPAGAKPLTIIVVPVGNGGIACVAEKAKVATVPLPLEPDA